MIRRVAYGVIGAVIILGCYLGALYVYATLHRSLHAAADMQDITRRCLALGDALGQRTLRLGRENALLWERLTDCNCGEGAALEQWRKAQGK